MRAIILILVCVLGACGNDAEISQLHRDLADLRMACQAPIGIPDAALVTMGCAHIVVPDAGLPDAKLPDAALPDAAPRPVVKHVARVAAVAPKTESIAIGAWCDSERYDGACVGKRECEMHADHGQSCVPYIDVAAYDGFIVSEARWGEGIYRTLTLCNNARDQLINSKNRDYTDIQECRPIRVTRTLP